MHATNRRHLLPVCLFLPVLSTLGADIRAVLDSTDGSSAFAVTDAQTNQRLRVMSDGVLIVSNTVNRGSGARNMITVTGGDDVEIGLGADGYNSGVAVGYHANGASGGAAVGVSANGLASGAGVGYYADGYDYGAALGYGANGVNYGVAVGRQANARRSGVGVGAYADGTNYGTAVGYYANGANTNVAIGYLANAQGGLNRIAIGPYVVNDINHSARLRGTLYLDGGAGVYYRPVFGSGGWTSLSGGGGGDPGTNYVLKVGDNMSGPLNITVTTDRGLGPRSLLMLGGGEDVEIGAGANGYDQGAAVGYLADGYYAGAAMGYRANGNGLGAAVGGWANGYNLGVAVGSSVKGHYYGAAVGYAANGCSNGVAMGYEANAHLGGAAVGYQANGAKTNVAIGYAANAQGGLNRIAIGPQVVNDINDSARLRGTLYLDGGAGVYYRPVFGSGGWTSLSGGEYVLKAGDTMTGALTITGAVLHVITNADRGFGPGSMLTIGGGEGVEIGPGADGYIFGVAVGAQAKAQIQGVAIGNTANGESGVAVGNYAEGSTYGTAVGREANGVDFGVALGYQAAGTNRGVAVGQDARGNNYGVALGCGATGENYSVAIGYAANGQTNGVAVGPQANAYFFGAAAGSSARASSYGAALGYSANAYLGGAAVGYQAKGWNYGVAMGYQADGNSSGAAIGRDANGVNTNVAIGSFANAQGGLNRIAIGQEVANEVDHSARLRGTLYLDGGTGVMVRSTFGSGAWSAKAFTIPHPLDPENKVLRHFCMEGPEVWNVYAGNAQLVNGEAVVELPDYYAALNLAGSEIYSLTPVGGRAAVWVAREAGENQFAIGGDADLKVSWTIKVRRNDPACVEDLKRRPVEQLRSEVSEEQRTEENRALNTGM